MAAYQQANSARIQIEQLHAKLAAARTAELVAVDAYNMASYDPDVAIEHVDPVMESFKAGP